MANSKRNFIQGKMNKSLDERLVPNGQYIDAMNVRLGSTEDSEIGSVENSKGNTLLTDITLGVYNSISYTLSSNSVCIGAFEDGANETIYWFIHDETATDTATGKADLIVSFEARKNSTTTHVISFKNIDDPTNTTLNFNKRYLINNVDKVGDLLFFTDNYNPPRNINVNKDYAYPLTITGNDEFSYNSLLVIVKPPSQAPIVTPFNQGDSDSFMEDKFLCFAYRYKYEDKEYSAISQFTNPVFIPSNFSIINGLNEGMVNSINSAIISFNTGDSLVKGVDILFKESSSNIIKVVETLDKSKLNYPDNSIETFTFSNKKIFTILSSGEILRLYDNVPLLSNSQTLMGNRLMYGNYYEGYDVDSNLDYYTDLESSISSNVSITSGVENFDYNVSGNTVNVPGLIGADLSSVKDKLNSGSTLTIQFNAKHYGFDGNSPTEPTETTGIFETSFRYILPKNFSSVADLVDSEDFQTRFSESSALSDWCDGTSLTDVFNCRVPNSLGSAGGSNVWNKFTSGSTVPDQGFFVSSLGSFIFIVAPAIAFTDDIANPNAAGAYTEWEFYTISNVSVNFINSNARQSLHSNRGYEVGMVYMDEFNRATSVLTSDNNNEFIPCSASDTINKLKVVIPPTQRAPLWAKRFKFVLKSDVDNYETIYSRFYFTDPLDNNTYFLLEGENIAKVEEGDTFTVKTDSQGALETCSTATVLEKKSQAEDFITPPPVGGVAVLVPAGVYMKILANNFTATTSVDAFVLPKKQRVRTQSVSLTNPSAGIKGRAYLYYKNFQKSITVSGSNKTYTNYSIPIGSKIRIDFNLYRNEGGLFNGCDKRSYRLERDFVSTGDYADIIEWWNGSSISNIIDSGVKSSSGIKNTFIEAIAQTTSDVDAFRQVVIDEAGEGSTTKYFYQWYKSTEAANLHEIKFLISGTRACGSSIDFGGSANIICTFSIVRADAEIVFETEPSDALPDVWYEGQDSYPISTDGNGFHLDGGNFASPSDQDQSATQDGEFFLNFFNCYSFGNGVESYKIKDSITGDSFKLGNRVTSVAEQEYKRTHRASDITYSGLYNQETNVNRLNEFNLGLLNFKPLEDSFGNINKIDGRKTDILVLQENKISYVLAGKNLLSDASGGNVLTSVPEVLGVQVARTEDYGISNNPESFVSYGSDKFFTDSRRGALLQLKGSSASNEQLNVISEYGMRSWFRDLFTDSFKTQKLGGYDPYMNEYVLTSNDTTLPEEEVCSPCGTSRTIDFTADALDSTQTFCINLPTTTGITYINYDVPAGSLIGISINYQGVITSHTNLSGIGRVSYPKGTTSPNTASITVINTLGSSVSTITPQCPEGSLINLKTIVLTNNDDVGKFLHIGHTFTDVNSATSSPDTQIKFIENTTGAAVFASVFTEQSGFKGDSIFPTNDSNVNLRTNKWLPVDDYDVDSQDKFRYLISNINYGNTATDLTTLLGLSTTLTKTGSNPTFTSSSFLYNPTIEPTVQNYLYLIYDFRVVNPRKLCVQEGLQNSFNLDAVCCECNCASTNTEYTITNASVTTITVTTSSGNTVQLGGTSMVFCSSLAPTYTPVVKGVTIEVTDCGCTP